jgi:HAMP domain-containing protein
MLLRPIDRDGTAAGMLRGTMDKRKAKREAYAIAAAELESFLLVGAHVAIADDPDDSDEVERIEEAFRELADSLRRRVGS